MPSSNERMNKLKDNHAYKIWNHNRHINEYENYDVIKRGLPQAGVATTGFPMVFITTPLLNLNSENINASDYFSYLDKNNGGVLDWLNYGSYGSGTYSDKGIIYQNGKISHSTNSPFIKILTNRYKNIDVPDIKLDTKEFGETPYGFKGKLPTSSIQSINAGDLSISFTETQDFRITNLFKAWTEYIDGVGRGNFVSSPYSRMDKLLDYTSAIYVFNIANDMTTIKSYAKFTGCAPTSVPISSGFSGFGENQNIVEPSIDFSYSYYEANNPQILADFNLTMNDGDPQTSSGLTTNKQEYFWLSSNKAARSIETIDDKTNYTGIATDPTTQMDWSNVKKANVVLQNYNKESGSSKYRYQLLWQGTSDVIQRDSEYVSTGTDQPGPGGAKKFK